MPRSRAPAPATTSDETEPAVREDALQPTLQLAEEIWTQLDRGEIPRMRLPLRTKQNLEFRMREGVWKLGRQMGTRSARKLDGALMLLRTFYLVDFINEMAQSKKTSTL
ncbi:DNA topoisomerase VI subunit A, partial [mine drainage metagenome]